MRMHTKRIHPVQSFAKRCGKAHREAREPTVTASQIPFTSDSERPEKKGSKMSSDVGWQRH